MYCTAQANRTATSGVSRSQVTATGDASSLGKAPTRIDMVPFGKNQWVPMPVQATLAAPDALHFATYDFTSRRWDVIDDKTLLTALTAVFKERARAMACSYSIYHWDTGDKIFCDDYEIETDRFVRLKVEVL